MKFLTLAAIVSISISLSAQPSITSFSPLSATAGSTVVITGTNFSPTPANNIVYFGIVKATVNGTQRNLQCLASDIGYRIVNLSPFFLDGSGKRISEYETILAGKELIRRQTFFNLLSEKFAPMITNDALLRFDEISQT